MISVDKIKDSLFQFMAAYSNEMVLYDNTGKRVLDPSESFCNIWCNDIRIYTKLIYGRYPTLHCTVMGKRNKTEMTNLISALQSFCRTNFLMFKIDISDSYSTPAKEANKSLAEALYMDWQKRLPTNDNSDKIEDSIDDTSASLFDVLMQASTQLRDYFLNTNIQQKDTYVQSLPRK